MRTTDSLDALAQYTPPPMGYSKTFTVKDLLKDAFAVHFDHNVHAHTWLFSEGTVFGNFKSTAKLHQI